MYDEKRLNDDEGIELSDEEMESVDGGVRMYFCVFDESGQKQYMSRYQDKAEEYAQQHGGTVRRIAI